MQQQNEVVFLGQVMEKLGHQWIDVLKMDIEGHEWNVFGDFYAKPGSRLPATQLLVEFHWPGNSDRVWQVCMTLKRTAEATCCITRCKATITL